MPIYNEESVGFKYSPTFDLSGGMVTNYNFAKLKRSQYARLLNGDLVNDGSVTKRKGRAKVNTTAISSNPAITSLAAIGQTTGADLILAGGGGNLNEVSTGTPVLIKSGLNASAYLSNITLDNYTFYCNGVDKPFMTTGAFATTFNVGIPEFTAAQYAGITMALGAAAAGVFVGLTAGTHRFAYRYRSTSTGARSKPRIVVATVNGSLQDVINGSTSLVSAGGETLNITIGAAAVSADPQVNKIDVFMQEANAAIDAPYYFIQTVPNAAGGPFNFPTAGLPDPPDISDISNILRERLDVDDNQPPVTLRDIETWRGRLIGIVDDYHIQFSKQRIDQSGFVNLPTSWPELNSLEVGFGDGDPLVKVVRFFDYIFAFKRRSIWLLLGNFNSGNFEFKRLKTNYTNIGLLNQKSVAQAGDRCFFVSDSLKFNYFKVTDFDTEQLRLREPVPSDPVADLFNLFASQFRDNVNLVNFSFSSYTQIWIAFSDGSSGFDASENFNVFVYDYSSNGEDGAWSIHTGIEVASSVLARDSSRNYSVFTGDYFGFVWENGVTDGDGAEINGTSTGLNYDELAHGAVTNPPFVVGETVTGGTSGSTGTIIFVGGGFIRVNATSGPFSVGEVITGATSAAFATISGITGVLNDTTQSFTAALVGTFITILSGTGVNQIRRISSVPSATQVKIISGWTIIPTSLSTYTIGGINFQLWSRFDWLDDEAPPDFDKQGWYLDLDFETGGDFGINVELVKDRGTSNIAAVSRDLIVMRGALWGFGIWGIDIWGASEIHFGQVGFDLLFKQIQHKILRPEAGMFVKVNGWNYCYQQLENVRKF